MNGEIAAICVNCKKARNNLSYKETATAESKRILRFFVLRCESERILFFTQKSLICWHGIIVLGCLHCELGSWSAITSRMDRIATTWTSSVITRRWFGQHHTKSGAAWRSALAVDRKISHSSTMCATIVPCESFVPITERPTNLVCSNENLLQHVAKSFTALVKVFSIIDHFQQQ